MNAYWLKTTSSLDDASSESNRKIMHSIMHTASWVQLRPTHPCVIIQTHAHTKRTHARTLTLLRKISNSTKTSDFYSRLIFSNGIWQRWCQFVFFQICNLNASRMNNDIMYIIIYVLNVVGRSRYAIHQGYKYWPKEREKMQTTTPTATAAYIHKKQSSQPRSA